MIEKRIRFNTTDVGVRGQNMCKETLQNGKEYACKCVLFYCMQCAQLIREPFLGYENFKHAFWRFIGPKIYSRRGQMLFCSTYGSKKLLPAKATPAWREFAPIRNSHQATLHQLHYAYKMNARNRKLFYISFAPPIHV